MKKQFFLLLLGCCTFYSVVIGQDQWQFNEVLDGIKPSIYIGPNDDIHIASIKEDLSNGYILYSNSTDSNVVAETVQEGYFYGPIDIAAFQNVPIIAWHHHNAGEGSARGELAFGAKSNGAWTVDIIENDGHDGWDGTFVVTDDGVIHAITTDPSNGIEYVAGNPGNWLVETVEDIPAMYQYGTDIELDNQGNEVHVVYFIDSQSELKFATRSDEQWTTEVVDTNAVFPKLIMDDGIPTIIYFKASRPDGIWSQSGQVVIAQKVEDEWQYETIDTLDGIDVGNMSGARELVDIQADHNNNLHIAYSDKKQIKYAIRENNAWSIQSALDVSSESFDLGQQVSLAMDTSGIPHIVTYRRLTDNDGRILHGTISQLTDTLSVLVCPPDDTIACTEFITPDITGFPDNASFAEFTFEDSIVQSCPDDILIDRYWSAIIDSEVVETCIQRITVLIDSSSNFETADTLFLKDECISELDASIESSLNLPCVLGIDNVNIDVVENSCDKLILDAEWSFLSQCEDTLISSQQTIVINDRIVGKHEETVIQADTGNASGGIMLLSGCPLDTLTYNWSNGATTPSISNINSGEYSLIIANQAGCMDTLDFVVPFSLAMIDTMMIDTMMIDTMMIDTMMMDTMMMDTIMMDTTMIDTMMMDTMMMDTSGQMGISATLMLNIIDRDTMRFIPDSVFFITTNSTIVGSNIDSLGHLTVDTLLSAVVSVCFIEEGIATDDLSATDLTRGQRIFLQLNEGCAEDRIALDVSGDGKISGYDLVLMRSILLGRIQNYPEEITHRFIKNLPAFSPDQTEGSCIRLTDDDRRTGVLDIISIKLGDLQCED